jgi:hypothetical protein
MKHCMFALACCAALLGTPQAAEACSCICFDDPWESWLEMTHTVPLNPRLLLSTSLAARAVLRGSDGSTIELDGEPSGIDGATWVRPHTALRPRQLYTLATRSDTGTGLTDTTIAFAVRDEADNVAPIVEGARIDPFSQVTCGLALGATLNVNDYEDAPDPAALIYAQIVVDTLSGRDRVIVPLQRRFFSLAEFGLAAGAAPDKCLLSRFVAHARIGSPTVATVTFFDLAGNATVDEKIAFTFGVVTQSNCYEYSSPRSIADDDAGAERDAGAPPHADVQPTPARSRRPHEADCSLGRAQRGGGRAWLFFCAGLALLVRWRAASRPGQAETRR